MAVKEFTKAYYKNLNKSRFVLFCLIAMYPTYFYFKFFPGWGGLSFLVFFFLGMSISTFNHRYFAHRSYEMNRFFQFCAALLTNLSWQKDPIWWAAMHRKHHLHADTLEDPHSPVANSPLHVFVFWTFLKDNEDTPYKLVQDWLEFPELRWLNRHPFLLPTISLLAFFLHFIFESYAANPHGNFLEWIFTPGDGALDQLAGAYLLPLTAVFWYTGLTNFLGHTFGRRIYEMPNQSRNSILHAFISVGEGWHNNHHYHPHSANFAYRWWHLDIGFYYIQILEILGIAKNVKKFYPEQGKKF